MKSEITQRAIVSFAKKLMEIPSTEENISAQKKCLSLITEEFGGDFFVQEYLFKKHPALVLSTTKNKEADIILSGHTDVVSGPQELFVSEVSGSILSGRGAYDMKAALVACMYAVQEYKAKGGPLDIAVLITSDEETSGYGTQQLLQKNGYRSKFALIPDGGSETNIVLRQKGFLQCKVTLEGVSAHASDPWKGTNPIENIQHICEKMKSAYPIPTEEHQWQTSVIPTRVETEGDLNQIPNSAAVYFDVRYVETKDYEKVLDILKEEAGKNGQVEIIAENGIFLVEEHDPFVQQLRDSIKRISGKETSFAHENGTSDAIFFAEKGIPVALFRPEGGGAHQDSEWVNTNSLFQMYEVVGDFLEHAKLRNLV